MFHNRVSIISKVTEKYADMRSPSIGAYFASRSLPNTAPSTDRWNVFALPAAISLGLLVVETLYLALKLPETRDWSEKQAEKGVSDAKPITSVVDSVEARLRKLRAMGRLHGLFLLFFSGVRSSVHIQSRADFPRQSSP